MTKNIYVVLVLILISFHCLAGNEDVKLFSLYPVPLKASQLSVQLNANSSGITSFELRNLIGKKIQEKSVPFGANLISFNDLDMNPNGIYIMLAKDANGKVLEILKFTINK